MQRKAKIKIAVAAVGLVLTVLLLKVIFLPSGPDVVCHRGLDGAIQQWMLEAQHTNEYPNVEGSSEKSIALSADAGHPGVI